MTDLFNLFPPISKEEWDKKIEADLKGKPFSKLQWKTDDGFNVNPYYLLNDIKDINETNSLPNEFPYTRGYSYQGNKWLIRQNILFNTIDNANKSAVDAINKGATSLTLSTKNIHSKQDLALLLNQIDITKIEINYIEAIDYEQLIYWLIDYATDNNIAKNEIIGSINFDPLCYLMLHGKFYESEQTDMIAALDIFKTIKQQLPKFHALNINLGHFHNAGSTNVQELGFGLAAACYYVDYLLANQISIDEIQKHTRITLSIGGSYFKEIAKIRALRTLWANMIKAFDDSYANNTKISINTETGLWNKSIFDPYVNMLRTTTETMSAIIAGCHSHTVNPFDTAYNQPNAFSDRIARNTQLLLKHESFFDKVSDPSAGSYYIETLTKSLAEEAWKLFQTIEEKGGFTRAAIEGFITNEIEIKAEEKLQKIASRRKTIVGINQYPNIDERMLEKITKEQEINTPDIKPQFKPIKLFRGVSIFEEIRLETERYEQKTKKLPTVFLLTIGHPAMRTARATFATNFFGCAGYKIINNIGFDNAKAGIDKAIEANANIVVICSSDDEYVEHTPVIAEEIKKQNKEIKLVIAGNPTETKEQLTKLGVDDFIHLKVNIYDTLKKYQSIFIK